MNEVIKKQILAIRATGKTNMFDVPKVREIAIRDGYSELNDFLIDNTAAYARFILTGEEN